MHNLRPRAEHTRQRILDVAAHLCRTRGYAGVSLRDIAAEAGMKAGSLYYHFASKEEIIVEVLDIGINLVHVKVADTINDLDISTPAAEVVRRAIAAHLAAFLLFSDYTSANVRIFGQVPESVRAANLPARRRYEALWDRILEQLRETGELRPETDLHAARLFLLGAMNSTLEWFDPARSDIDRLAEKYADFMLFGLLKHRAANQ
jgi:TetR/AcrR family transcriptional regulator, cholesterol catabolism regulator